MKLENFLALTRTTLLNSPEISSFENISFDASRIKRGDMFFAYDKNEINNAIENGAYAVVFEGDVFQNDSEVAWIKTKNLDETLKKIIRFVIIEKELIVYECDDITLKLSLQIQLEGNFCPLHGNLHQVYKTILNLEKSSFLLFSPDITDSSMFASVKKIPKQEKFFIKTVEKTLFETSFICDEIFYERQPLSPFFIPFLKDLLFFLKTLGVEYRLKKFTQIDNFEAIFVNKTLNIKSFGTTEKVLIFEPNMRFVEDEILFIKNNSAWASAIFLMPCRTTNQSDKTIFFYKNEDDILKILMENSFNFALVAGVSKSILENQKPQQMQLLF